MLLAGNAEILIKSLNLFIRNKVKNYSTCVNKDNSLNPYWVTGFTDAEGCFSVIISKRSNLNWRVQVSFEINLHIKDIAVLYLIKNFFGVGSVNSRENRSNCVYRVTKIEDLIKVIIPHFIKYPLLTQKYADFFLWSKVVKLMDLKQHLIPSGFDTVLSFYASINKGMSQQVLTAFPNIKGAVRINPILPDLLNPYWVSGFVAGDGGFSIGIRAITGQIYFRFHIAQHSRDILLMNKFINFFNCGKVHIRSNINRCDFLIQDFNNIYNIIIPHFDKYPLKNIKQLDYIDFKIAVNLFKSNGKKSTDIIKQIISNMNSNREY